MVREFLRRFPVERLIELVAGESGTNPESPPHVYLVSQGEAAVRKALLLAEELRSALPGLRLVSNCGAGSFKSQFKRADRSRALWAMVLGDEELAQNTVVLKPLRSEVPQENVAMGDLEARLRKLAAEKG